MEPSKKKPGIGAHTTYVYIKNIRKWMSCPACKKGKMTFNKKKFIWTCEDCNYHFTEEYFLDDCAFWFCDECGIYLNNQEGFDRQNRKHICCNCGYENDTTFDNTKGVCCDCGKLLPNEAATLCADCRQARQDKAKQWLITAGKIVAGIAVAAGAIILAASAKSDEENANYTYLPDLDDDNNDEEACGLGEEKYPICKTCGAKMTDFDGWAWYRCPDCGDAVRIIGGEEVWQNEIFDQSKGRDYSDFELADLCRGGELTEN